MKNLLNNLLKLLGFNGKPKVIIHGELDTFGNMIWSTKYRRMIHYNKDGSVNH